MRLTLMLRFLAAAPPVLVTAAVLAFTVLEVAGRTPASLGPPRNVAEAAGMGVGSEILRLLRAGQDPRRVWPVRAEIISSSVTKATALEAAVWSRKRQVIDVLARQGALADPESRRQVSCLARDLQAQEIVDYLGRATDAPSCAPGEMLARVLERSKQP